jgi:Xaa-Pro aminopeptidase
VHRTAATVIARGLAEIGILKGSAENLAESGVVSLFFPHGVGHMLGLMIRDVGGRAPGRKDGCVCCGSRLRVDLPLDEGFVMTVEPGVYFVPAILDDPDRRSKFKNEVAWDALSKWRVVGGVRIEDDILVTAKEPKVLTAAIPK